MGFKIISTLYVIIQLTSAQSIIGYDCAGNGVNITKVSLLDVGECYLPRPDTNVTSQLIRLYQTRKYRNVNVMQCKVIVNRVITHCGMFSHSTAVAGGVLEYLEDVSREQCEQLHTTGTIRMGHSAIITGAIRNSTIYRAITLAGKVTFDGTCDGTQYSEFMTAYEDVVVQASVTITLTSYAAKVNSEKNTINLNSGVVCTFSKEKCMDNLGGNSFWKNNPLDQCHFEEFDILYEGVALKSTLGGDYTRPLYTVISQQSTFSIMATGHKQVCGYTIATTEHPRLFISEITATDRSMGNKNVMTENIDIIMYVNAKIVHVERHIRRHLETLYYDISMQRCYLERKVLKNLLSIATMKPDEFAYNLMDGPGYMAVVTGEVVRIIKCTPVPVIVRRPDPCYLELPVFNGNSSYYLTPKTHILLRKGTQILCDGTIPSTYKIGNKWYEITPKARAIEEPEIIKPTTAQKWTYEDPGSLATNGIYTEEELNNLQERILFPMEQPAVLHTLASGAVGQKVDSQGISIEHLLNEDSVDKMLNSFWSRAWTKFNLFGNAIAGLIGIFVAIRLLKGLIDTILQGYALHRVYGWSIKLLGAVLTSVTQLLLTLASEKEKPSTTPQECIPLTSIDVEAQNQPKESQKPSHSKLSPPTLSDDISHP